MCLEVKLKNEAKEAECRKSIMLYSSARAMSTRRERVLSPGAAWGSRMPEAYSLVGISVRPDEAEPQRWILTNGSGHPVYVQHPSFCSPVIKVQEGSSIVLVEGSRITGSPNGKWLTVSIS